MTPPTKSKWAQVAEENKIFRSLLERAECEMRYAGWTDRSKQDANQQRTDLLLEIQKALS